MTPNNWQTAVQQFHRAMDYSTAPDSYQPLSDEARQLRITLINEEFGELIEALGEGDVVESVDALCDLLYVVIGTAVQMGISLAPYFAEVHDSNMSKLGGKRREDGKHGKGPNYQSPRIRQLMEKLNPEVFDESLRGKSTGISIDNPEALGGGDTSTTHKSADPAVFS